MGSPPWGKPMTSAILRWSIRPALSFPKYNNVAVILWDHCSSAPVGGSGLNSFVNETMTLHCAFRHFSEKTLRSLCFECYLRWWILIQCFSSLKALQTHLLSMLPGWSQIMSQLEILRTNYCLIAQKGSKSAWKPVKPLSRVHLTTVQSVSSF